MKFTNKITGPQAANNPTTVIRNITSEVYYQEPGYNLYQVTSTGAFEFYLNEFIVPIGIYLASGTGTLEIFPPQVGGDTIDGELSITLNNSFEGVTVYSLGAGRYAAQYWKPRPTSSDTGTGGVVDLGDRVDNGEINLGTRV